MNGDHGFGLQFGNDVLYAALAETGEADEVDVSTAEETHGGLGPGFTAFKHQAVDGILARSEAIGDALDGAESDGSF